MQKNTPFWPVPEKPNTLQFRTMPSSEYLPLLHAISNFLEFSKPNILVNTGFPCYMFLITYFNLFFLSFLDQQYPCLDAMIRTT